MRINERLKQIRTKKGIKQTFIAKKLGKTSAWYSNIENGRRELKAEDAKKIAGILGVDANKLFFEDELNTTFNINNEKN